MGTSLVPGLGVGKRFAPAEHLMALSTSGTNHRCPVLLQNAMGHCTWRSLPIPCPNHRHEGAGWRDGSTSRDELGQVVVQGVRDQGSRLLMRTLEGRQVGENGACEPRVQVYHVYSIGQCCNYYFEYQGKHPPSITLLLLKPFWVHSAGPSVTALGLMLLASNLPLYHPTVVTHPRKKLIGHCP